MMIVNIHNYAGKGYTKTVELNQTPEKYLQGVQSAGYDGHDSRFCQVNAWNSGDIKESQKHYEYILGWCESAGYDFSATLNGGLNRLIAKCVGIEDTKKYTQYLNGTANFQF